MVWKAELTERQRYWLEHVQACEESGLSSKAYAEANQLSVSMLYSWRRDLVAKGAWPSPAQLKTPVGFDRVEIGALGRPVSEWRIVLPNGVEVGFSGGVEGSTLSSVLEVVGRL